MGLSPAKINLYLDVLGRREDGFHDLETLFAPLTFGDTVEVELAGSPGEVRLALDGPVAVPAGDENLALRAARAWSAAAGHDGGVEIRLTKQVPVGSGLGGGSSNAAAVLRLANAASADPLAPEALHQIAAGLGSDVPFFLGDGPAVGRGRGEILEPVAGASGLFVVLIMPAIACDTAAVYRNLGARVRGAPADGLARSVAALAAGDAAALRDAHYNALAVPALGAYPALLRLTSEVEQRLGRPPCLSGSGSTLYDIVSAPEASAVSAALEGLPADIVVATLGT